MKKVIFKYFNRFLCKNQNLVFRHVRKTPSIRSDIASDTVVYSIVSSNSINMYLLAIKSFFAATEHALRVIVQSDGSLDSEAKSFLKHHVEGVTIFDPGDARDIVRKFYSPDMVSIYDAHETNLFVKYQLLAFFALAGQSRKCLHFDSDVVFPSKLQRVCQWIDRTEPYAFHFPGGNSLRERVQKLSLSSANLPCNAFNAGFFGVPSDDRYRKLIEDAIALIRLEDPTLLSTWEIAQALVAYVLGESIGSKELGSDFGESIATGWSDWNEIQKATVVHFVGSTRFRGLYYPRVSRTLCRKFRQNSH